MIGVNLLNNYVKESLLLHFVFKKNLLLQESKLVSGYAENYSPKKTTKFKRKRCIVGEVSKFSNQKIKINYKKIFSNLIKKNSFQIINNRK